MTNTKTLLTAGLLLGASAVFAAPTVEVKGIGAKSGGEATAQIIVHPNGVKLGAAVFYLEASAEDASKIDLVPTGATAPPGWDTPVTNQVIRDGKKWILSVNATSNPTDEDPLIFTVKITQKGTGFTATKIRLIGYNEETGDGTNMGDDQYNTIGVPDAYGAIVNGASRDLGGPMNNAVSAAPGVIAAAAGSSLWLLNSATADLAPMAGWETAKPLDGPVSGRPAFGALDGKLAMAVGTDAGTLYAFDAASGAAAGSYKGDFVSIPTAPAIGADNNVFVAGTTATGVQVARVNMAGGSAVLGEAVAVGAASTTVQSSPAVSGNALVVGTNATVFYANVAPGTGVMTPQAVAGVEGVAFNTSPVVSGGFAFVGDATGKVWKINLATGAVAGSSAAIAAPLSDPFAQGGNVHFGGGDGNVYTFAGGDVTAEPAKTAVGTTPVVSPVDTGSLVVAATQGGMVKAGANSVDLGPGIGKAIVVLPGAPATVVVNKVDGTVYAIPTE